MRDKQIPNTAFYNHSGRKNPYCLLFSYKQAHILYLSILWGGIIINTLVIDVILTTLLYFEPTPYRDIPQ